jgi:hypothetical protein
MTHYKPISGVGNDGRQILCCFKHKQKGVGWIHFIAWAHGENTQYPGFAKPTHFAEIPEHEEPAK